MSLTSSDRAIYDRASLPSAGPFAPVPAEAKAGNEVWRALLTSMLALYPVLAAVAVALLSMTLMGPGA